MIVVFFYFLNILFLYITSSLFLTEFNSIQLSKSFCAITVLSWYGSTVSWPRFKARYLNSKFLKSTVISIDKGIYQGIILLDQIQKRFQTLKIRAKSKYFFPQNIGLGLAGGIASALERSSNIENFNNLRSRQEACVPKRLLLKLCECSVRNHEILKIFLWNFIRMSGFFGVPQSW